MARRVAILLLVLLAASPLLSAAQKASPKAPAAAKAAPGPSSSGTPADTGAGVDINKELKGDQFSQFRQWLHDTRVDTQLNAQLTDPYSGLTVLAPTNTAFNQMKAGVFNSLTPQEQIQMVLYCVLPRYYSLSMLGNLDKPVTTQGSGKEGPYTFDIKRAGNNVNVSTGVNSFLLGAPVRKDFPLALYPIDKVPLPYELFGPKAPTPAPAPAPAPAKSKTKKKKKSPAIAEPPAADDAASTSDNQKAAAAPGAAGARWVGAALSVGAAVLAGGLF